MFPHRRWEAAATYCIVRKTSTNSVSRPFWQLRMCNIKLWQTNPANIHYPSNCHPFDLFVPYFDCIFSLACLLDLLLVYLRFFCPLLLLPICTNLSNTGALTCKWAAPPGGMTVTVRQVGQGKDGLVPATFSTHLWQNVWKHGSSLGQRYRSRHTLHVNTSPAIFFRTFSTLSSPASSLWLAILNRACGMVVRP